MLSEGASKILLDAADFLEKNKWTTGTLARKANGRSDCSPFDKDAKCFCMLGAMARVSDAKFHGSNFTIDHDNPENAMYTYFKGKSPKGRVSDENLHEALVYLSGKYHAYGSLYRINDHILKSKKKVIKLLRENAKQ